MLKNGLRTKVESLSWQAQKIKMIQNESVSLDNVIKYSNKKFDLCPIASTFV